MSDFVYLLAREEPYEGSYFMGIFSTMAKAKAEATRAYPNSPLKWRGDRRTAYVGVDSGYLNISKIRVDESNY